MREIKFRSWVKKEKRFINEFSMHVGCNSEEETHVLQQYIGLKDKNGKEIYEGDIVKIEYFYGSELYEVKWIKGIAGFHAQLNVKSYDSEDIDTSFCRKCEVVGNIYENPELLG